MSEASNARPTVWTVGHSTHAIEAFVELLKDFNIENLVDIRGLPGSRRCPQFNQECLKPSLEAAGIHYHHLKQLGGRRRVRKDSPNIAWHNASFRGYADYMETAEFEAGLAALEVIARERRTAFMCAEAVWWRCHRSMVADRLKAEGWDVEHILGLHQVQEHPFTAPARVVDGELTYREEPSVDAARGE